MSSCAMARREAERERRPRSHLALHPDPAPVQLDELPGEGQPEPGAFYLLVRRPYLPELLEDRLLVLRGDTHPRVPDRHLHRPVPRHGSDLDPAPFRREFDRI